MSDTSSLIPAFTLRMMADTAAATPPGCFVEVGVYRGGSALLLYDVARNLSADIRDIHLFDTFCGIPYADKIDHHHPGEFNGTDYLPILQRLMPDAVFHVGIFPDTLTNDIQDIAFAHIDCDQYRSVRDCIACLWPRIVPGGIMWFDDFSALEGARAAVTEQFLNEELKHAPEGRRFVVKTS